MRQFLKKRTKLILICAIFICGTVVVAVFLRTKFNIFPQLITSATSSHERVTFPDSDYSRLSDQQQKIIAILRTEHAGNPDGTKYSEGVREPWCADFVSWVFNRAGRPLENPNSGSWRIPGTYTLRKYYESIGKFIPADNMYSPKVGDIMLYDNPSPFGQHTNIVIKNDDGIVTTVGGNEPGGIRVFMHTIKDDDGFVGYGEL